MRKGAKNFCCAKLKALRVFASSPCAKPRTRIDARAEAEAGKPRRDGKDFIMTYRNRYSDAVKQNAYMNACDCLYYGYGRGSWNACGLSAEDADEVWQQAHRDTERFD